VIHAGVDTDLFSPRPMPKSSRPTVCMVGRITPDKGVTTLVEAACIAAAGVPGLEVILLGRGDPALVRSLHETARARGHDDLLETPGFIAREELPDRLAAAHLFALPSYHEPGPGMVYLEAMACGLPVIGCEGAGAAEVIEHGMNGILVRPRDPEDLAGALQTALRDPARLRAMAVRARDYASRVADSRECVRSIEAFYQTVTARSRRAAA
jgi:glycosyltransferase involved in cell wall biosynthesis